MHGPSLAETTAFVAVVELKSFTKAVRDGGLMSYGPDLKECFERAAAMVDRIFKGTRPAELPFEQPTHYKFMINLSTAKAIGVEVPPTLLALADEVIE